MPNIKSQIKRMRKSEEQRQRNRSIKSAVKTHIRKFGKARDEGDLDRASELYRIAARALDKAVSKGVLHKNKAANEKSRMARELNDLKKASL